MSQEQVQNVVFVLDKIYVKDLSVEVPNAPQVFLNREQPNIELNFSFNTDKIDEGIYQTVLKATVNAKIKEQQLFLVEIEQAGIFQIRNIADGQLDLIFNIECPTIIFPYLRETISDLTSRAGFLPVMLAPVNFTALYQQRQEQLAADKLAQDHTIN